jgi:hypothetical protein
VEIPHCEILELCRVKVIANDLDLSTIANFVVVV